MKSVMKFASYVSGAAVISLAVAGNSLYFVSLAFADDSDVLVIQCKVGSASCPNVS